MIWTLVSTRGETLMTKGIVLMASASPTTSRRVPLVPVRTPPRLTEPSSIQIRFAPSVAIDRSTRSDAPSPMATMLITAPTPMETPRRASPVRSLFRPRAVPAMRTSRNAFIGSILSFRRLIEHELGNPTLFLPLGHRLGRPHVLTQYTAFPEEKN